MNTSIITMPSIVNRTAAMIALDLRNIHVHVALTTQDKYGQQHVLTHNTYLLDVNANKVFFSQTAFLSTTST